MTTKKKDAGNLFKDIMKEESLRDSGKEIEQEKKEKYEKFMFQFKTHGEVFGMQEWDFCQILRIVPTTHRTLVNQQYNELMKKLKAEKKEDDVKFLQYLRKKFSYFF